MFLLFKINTIVQDTKRKKKAQYTGKMYFSWRNLAKTFPKTWKTEKILVIQLNIATLFDKICLSLWQHSIFSLFFITFTNLLKGDLFLPHRQQKCRKCFLDLEYMKYKSSCFYTFFSRFLFKQTTEAPKFISNKR